MHSNKLCPTPGLPTSCRSSVAEAIDAAYDELIAGAPLTIEHGSVLEAVNAKFGIFGRYAVRVLEDEHLTPATDADGLVVAKIRTDDFSLSEMLYIASEPSLAGCPYLFIPSDTELTESVDADC